MGNKVLLEVCTGGYEDALNAYRGGASRIELNSALPLGGLTPNVATLKLIKKNTNLKVISMVRPRDGGFLYSENEYLQMKEDLISLLEGGSDGIAFGFLTCDFNIDMKRTKEFVDIIHSYNKEAVFHRAFDLVSNPYMSIEKLVVLHVDRVLTSGLQEDAYKGKELIKELSDKYGQQIQILPGCGINSSNVCEIIRYTGVSQIHSSCKDYKEDVTTSSGNVSFGYLKDSLKNKHFSVNASKVVEMLKMIN